MDFADRDCAAYKALMNQLDMKPLTYEAVAKDWAAIQMSGIMH